MYGKGPARRLDYNLFDKLAESMEKRIKTVLKVEDQYVEH